MGKNMWRETTRVTCVSLRDNALYTRVEAVPILDARDHITASCLERVCLANKIARVSKSKLKGGAYRAQTKQSV
jgi:hypothetical protein